MFFLLSWLSVAHAFSGFNFDTRSSSGRQSRSIGFNCDSNNFSACIFNDRDCVWNKDLGVCVEGTCESLTGEGKSICSDHDRCQWMDDKCQHPEKQGCEGLNYKTCLADLESGCIWLDQDCVRDSCTSVSTTWACTAHKRCSWTGTCAARLAYASVDPKPEPSTCENCVAAGRSWQGMCNPTANCDIQDTYCFKGMSECAEYYAMEVAKVTCKQISSCEDCANANYCSFNLNTGACFMSSGSSGKSSDAQTPSECKIAISPVVDLQPTTQVLYDLSTCEGCTSAGRSWQGSCRQSCEIMDVACYQTVDSCEAYHTEVSLARKCNELSSSNCQTCSGIDGCGWRDGWCFSTAGMWNLRGVYTVPDACPVPLELPEIVQIDARPIANAEIPPPLELDLPDIVQMDVQTIAISEKPIQPPVQEPQQPPAQVARGGRTGRGARGGRG